MWFYIELLFILGYVFYDVFIVEGVLLSNMFESMIKVLFVEDNYINVFIV